MLFDQDNLECNYVIMQLQAVSITVWVYIMYI